MQWLVSDAEHVVETVDLRMTPDPGAAALTWMRAAMAEAGGCDAGPLFFGAVLRVSDHRTLLFHRVHHIALDGPGMALFAERAAEVYSHLYEGSPVPPSGWSGLRALIDRTRHLFAHAPAHRAAVRADDDRPGHHDPRVPPVADHRPPLDGTLRAAVMFRRRPARYPRRSAP
ncbi:condensation domain-containing protein [Streptomyces antimycoticus]